MTLKLVLPKAQVEMLRQTSVRGLLEEFQKEADCLDLSSSEEISFLPVHGLYDNFEKSIFLISLFVNNTSRPVNEIDGELHLFLQREGVHIGGLQVQLRKEFIGCLGPKEAMMIHLKVPTKGLHREEAFDGSEFIDSFHNVHVGYADVLMPPQTDNG